MTTGLGVDPTQDDSGNFHGTTAQDIRQIYSGLYSPGLVSGANVTTSDSSMVYTVSTGVGMVKVASGQVVPVPIPAKTVNATTVDGSGRTDIIFAKQNFPETDDSSEVTVGVSTELPDNSIMIAKYTLPANATTTGQGHEVDSPDYSIPYGASLGNLHTFNYTTTGNLPNKGITRIGQKTIKLPTDRRLHFKVNATLQANGAIGFDNSKYCEYGFLPGVDGNDFTLWTTPGLHQSLATYCFEGYWNVTAGSHEVSLVLTQMAGPGRAYCYYGADSLGFGRSGIVFTVDDAGVWK